MYEMRPAYRGAAYARRPFGRFPLGFVPFLVLLGFMALASSGPYFPLFPLIPLLLLFVFFVAPAMRRSAVRGGTGSRRTVEARESSDGGEKELLRALERYEETTAVRAALETSLSVARAEEILAKLASGGTWDSHCRAWKLLVNGPTTLQPSPANSSLSTPPVCSSLTEIRTVPDRDGEAVPTSPR